MPVGGATEERRDRQPGDLADDVPQRDLERPVAAGVEVDRLEDADVVRDRQRIAADEQVLEGLEAVHRVARSDADDALVGLDPDDRRRERAARERVPGGRRTAGRAGATSRSSRMPGDAHVAEYRAVARRDERHATLRTGFVDSADGAPVPFRRSARSDRRQWWSGGVVHFANDACHVLVAISRARWRIKTDGLFPAGQGSTHDHPAATRRRRVVRSTAADPPRVHPARDDRRSVDGLDQRRHRRLRRRPRPSGSRRSAARRAPVAGGLADAGGTIRRRRPAPGARSTRSRWRTSAATASPPSRSSSCAR